MRHSDDDYLRRRPDRQYGGNDQGYSGIPDQPHNLRQQRLSGGRYGNTAERLPRDQTEDVTPGDEGWYGLYVEEWRWPAEARRTTGGRGDPRYEDEWSRRSPADARRGRAHGGGGSGYGEPERYGYGRWQDERLEREAYGYGGEGGDGGMREEWGAPARRRPVGPRNYRRDDDRIHDEVCNRLARDDELDVSDVEVRVQEGVVTLEGKVNDRRTKYDIEDIAERVFGVQDVINHIRVQRYGLLASE